MEGVAGGGRVAIGMVPYVGRQQVRRPLSALTLASMPPVVYGIVPC